MGLCGLRCRQTSKPSDEAICIATLLNLDIHKILNIESQSEIGQREKRMVQLWKMLGKVPFMLLFSPTRLLKAEGFRWAPSTLAGRCIIERPPLYRSGSPMCVIHQSKTRFRSVEFQSSGLLLECDVQPLHEIFWFKMNASSGIGSH